MRHPSRRAGGPATMPSLAEVQQNPTILTSLPVPVIVDLRRQISSPRRRPGRGLVPDPDPGQDAGPARGRRTRPAAHARCRGGALRCHQAVAPGSRRRDPGRPAAVAQDCAVQRATPRAVSRPNTGLTRGYVVPMLPPPGEAIERSVRMLRLWCRCLPPNAWAPSHDLRTMTRDDGAVHPWGSRP